MDLLEKHVLPRLLETFPKLGNSLHLTVRALAWPSGCLPGVLSHFGSEKSPFSQTVGILL